MNIKIVHIDGWWHATCDGLDCRGSSNNSEFEALMNLALTLSSTASLYKRQVDKLKKQITSIKQENT